MKVKDHKTGKIITVGAEGEEINPDTLDADSLGAMFEQNEEATQEEIHNLKVKEASKASEILFPRTTSLIKDKNLDTGSMWNVIKNIPQGAATMGLDISSDIFKVPGAIGSDIGMGLAGKESTVLGQVENLNKGLDAEGRPAQGAEKFIDELAIDPATPPSLMTGAGLGGWVFKGGRWLPQKAATQIGSAATKGVEAVGRGMVGAGAEGLVSSGIHQSENVTEGKPVSGKEVLAEVGGSMAAPLVLGSGGKLLNKTLGVLGSQLSNVSEDALRMWGTGIGKGAKKLKAFQGKQREIGQGLLKALDDFDQYIPEKPLIDDALNKMGNIPMERTVKTLEQTIKNFPNPNSNKKVVSSLNDLLTDVKAKGGELSATDFKTFRGQIDDMVEWSKPGAKGHNSALKGLRKSMKDELIETAEKSGNPEYKPLMELWSNKLQKRTALLEQIGANAKTRNNRIGSFMSTLFNENKDVKREALDNMTEIFGKDFVEQAKLMQLSSEVMQKGSQFAKILPNWTTGKSGAAMIPAIASGAAYGFLKDPKALAAAILLGAESSPMLASKTLKVADLVEWMAGQSKLPARKVATDNIKE